MEPSLATAYRLAEQAGSELDRGTTDRAIELSQRAIKLNERAFPAYLVLARANVAEGLSGEARNVLARAAEQQPDPVWLAEIVAQNGATWEAEGKPEAAIAAYRRALAIYPANQTAREALARLVPR